MNERSNLGEPTAEEWLEINERYNPWYESTQMDVHTDELDGGLVFDDSQVNRWTDIVFSDGEGSRTLDGYTPLARVLGAEEANESFFLGPNTPEWNATFLEWWNGAGEPHLLLQRQRLRRVGEYDEAG